MHLARWRKVPQIPFAERQIAAMRHKRQRRRAVSREQPHGRAQKAERRPEDERANERRYQARGCRSERETSMSVKVEKRRQIRGASKGAILLSFIISSVQTSWHLVGLVNHPSCWMTRRAKEHKTFEEHPCAMQENVDVSGRCGRSSLLASSLMHNSQFGPLGWRHPRS